MSDRYLGGELLAEMVRSDFVESRHSGSVVVLDAGGEVVAWAGDVIGAIFPRSSSKPLQAVGMVRAGLTLAPAELAVVAASHRGQPFHTAAVLRVLQAAGLDPTALGCPADYPLSDDARDDVVRSGGARSPLLMNCSGKHAGMLNTCVVNGWPVSSYLDAGHPLQRQLGRTIEALSGEGTVAAGIDGCGAPLLSLSLRGLATAFLALVRAVPGSAERQVADAMRAHPELVCGSDAGAEDTHLMRAVPGLIAKGGAEGVFAVAVPGVGAVAIKLDDGSMRARLPVLASALDRLGVFLGSLADVAVFGGGRPVGVVRSVW